jgi:tRNA threonylcarbamoyladenosine biosynthesis protein TsaE
MEVITKSAEETKSLGREIAAKLKGGAVFALTGDLGSGKTTFVQGFAQGLGFAGRIISPTFILIRKYGLKSKDFYHIDLYRFEENVWEEVKNLGIEEIWNDPNNIVVIEWAEKIKDNIPSKVTWIKFESMGEDEREITIL